MHSHFVLQLLHHILIRALNIYQDLDLEVTILLAITLALTTLQDLEVSTLPHTTLQGLVVTTLAHTTLQGLGVTTLALTIHLKLDHTMYDHC